MDVIDPSRCPECEEKLQAGHVLNRAEIALGIWSKKIAACASCLSVTRFVAEPYEQRREKRSFKVVSRERIASGGETARFLERAKAAADGATLTSLHANACSEEPARWLLRLPAVLPYLRPLFDRGATLATDVFGKVDGELGCLLVEARSALPAAAEFVPAPAGPGQDMLESPSTGILVRRWAEGRAGAAAVFAPGAPIPKGVDRAVCLTFPLGPVSGKHELVAVPPDLLLPA